MITEQLEKINKFTRRELTAEDVYIFPVVLCDNDIDRDCERFSLAALEQLQKLFIGRTGIFDHDAKSSHQSARIFDTEIVTDTSRSSKNGEPYTFLRAMVYMVRTDENKGLIAEIDGGIKKEVSISCSASERICSICGSDKTKSGCAHVKGSIYGGKLCHTVLSGITDAYEWSFVAVPAQVNAGVTKHFSADETVQCTGGCIEEAERELRRDIRRLAFFCGGNERVKSVSEKSADFNVHELIGLKKTLEAEKSSEGAVIQLSAQCGEKEALSEFSMK
ncbi:MAG: hypothetical protein PUA81_05070 [Oscillospiraceae bacterium]|nr:hypothetical protein [Oscillospiraceae bacterium]